VSPDQRNKKPSKVEKEGICPEKGSSSECTNSLQRLFLIVCPNNISLSHCPQQMEMQLTNTFITINLYDVYLPLQLKHKSKSNLVTRRKKKLRRTHSHIIMKRDIAHTTTTSVTLLQLLQLRLFSVNKLLYIIIIGQQQQK